MINDTFVTVEKFFASFFLSLEADDLTCISEKTNGICRKTVLVLVKLGAKKGENIQWDL